MHMYRVLAGTERVEGDGLPTLEQTAPLVAGLPPTRPNFITMARHPGKRRGTISGSHSR